MKTTYSAIFIAMFVILYYLVWTVTLPFFIGKLFLRAAAGDDDEIAMPKYKS